CYRLDLCVGVLDLWNCSLAQLDPTLHLTQAAVVLDLSSNPLRDLPSEFFRGLLGLQYVALPAELSCPGGVCQDQRSSCNSTSEWVLCPENSVCAPDGPGYMQCVCAPGFHGYKCLRESTFPILMFFGILGLVTACLSVLLWCTQRRKVKSQ
uniref:EGF-like domain-containing protein n=1 Tax=Xenopus tropicalis TaxID=8364 RepID=A0A803KEF1_XENTR